MTKLFEFGPEDIYLQIKSQNEINHMLKDKDRSISSKLINFLLGNFDNEEIYLGGSVLKNQLYNKQEDYNDIDLLVVSSSGFNYNFLQTKKNSKLENLEKISQNIPEINPTGKFPRYILENNIGTNFDIHFDYKKEERRGEFKIPEYK